MQNIFYGWRVLIGLLIAYTVSNGIIFYSMPVFYPKLIEEFGWTKQEVTAPSQLLYLGVAILAPFIGMLLDRFSSKKIMLLGIGIAALPLFWFSNLKNLGEMKMIFMLFALGITLAGILPSMYIITKWFQKKRGAAIGIFLLGSSLGAAIFNPISLLLINKFGWRTALMYLGIVLFVGMLLPIFLLVKDTPEEVNSIPDGEIGNFVFVGDHKITLKDALFSPMFYLILLVTGAMWFCVVGVQQHQPLYLKDLALDPFTTGFVVTAFFSCSVLGKIVFGFISDRLDKKMIMLSAMFCLAIGLTFLYSSNAYTINYLWCYAIIAGIGFSGTFTMIQIMVAEYYQGVDYGKILGVVTTVDTIAGVMGIVTLAKIRDTSGSYQQGFLYLVIICIVALLGGMFFKRIKN